MIGKKICVLEAKCFCPETKTIFSFSSSKMFPQQTFPTGAKLGYGTLCNPWLNELKAIHLALVCKGEEHGNMWLICWAN